jgi:hypothetical protein
MGLLPEGASIPNNIALNISLKPSKTFKIDFESGRVVGYTDKIEALKQAIYLILSTSRFEYIIFSWNYGNEVKGHVGTDRAIAESELKRKVKEALVQDDRIKNVDNFSFNYDEDSVLIKFTVFSIWGNVDSEVVV